MKRMKHLAYFNTTSEYETALANDELSEPRVVVIVNNEDNDRVIYEPLNEIILLLDSPDVYLGVNSKTIIAF